MNDQELYKVITNHVFPIVLFTGTYDDCIKRLEHWERGKSPLQLSLDRATIVNIKHRHNYENIKQIVRIPDAGISFCCFEYSTTQHAHNKGCFRSRHLQVGDDNNNCKRIAYGFSDGFAFRGYCRIRDNRHSQL